MKQKQHAPVRRGVGGQAVLGLPGFATIKNRQSARLIGNLATRLEFLHRDLFLKGFKMSPALEWRILVSGQTHWFSFIGSSGGSSSDVFAYNNLLRIREEGVWIPLDYWSIKTLRENGVKIPKRSVPPGYLMTVLTAGEYLNVDERNVGSFYLVLEEQPDGEYLLRPWYGGHTVNLQFEPHRAIVALCAHVDFCIL